MRPKEVITMTKTVSTLTATVLGLALAATASAQTPSRPATEPSTSRQDTSRAEPERRAWTPERNAVESRRLIGMQVRSTQGKEIGEIEQLIVDRTDGKISHVVLSRGGVLGVGGQKVVVPWSDVKIQPDTENRNRMVAMIDQAKLDSAPRYEARRDASPAASPSTSPGTTTQPRQEKKY
jgi:sporulation protein YlmC with PRC-barrel domain